MEGIVKVTLLTLLILSLRGSIFCLKGSSFDQIPNHKSFRPSDGILGGGRRESMKISKTNIGRKARIGKNFTNE